MVRVVNKVEPMSQKFASAPILWIEKINLHRERLYFHNECVSSNEALSCTENTHGTSIARNESYYAPLPEPTVADSTLHKAVCPPSRAASTQPDPSLPPVYSHSIPRIGLHTQNGGG